MPNTRRQARIVALQTLFEADLSRHDWRATLARLSEESGLGEAQASFASELVEGVMDKQRSLDDVITQAAPQWPLAQMSAVDRNVLRLAILEILVNNGAPIPAVINEAVELAKRYGSDNSAKFVNGVLGSVSSSLVR